MPVAARRLIFLPGSLACCFPFLSSQVKDDICDNPCSPDKTYCFVYACCGSRDGTYFTVAFAGQVS